MNESPQTKAELIAELTAGWQLLEDRLHSLSEVQLTVRRAPGEWSIKDHVAHLMAYELGMVAMLRHESRWAAMQLDEKFVHEATSFDALNAVLYEHHKERPAPAVLTIWRDTHQHLMAALADLTDDDLLKPYTFYQPLDPVKDGQNPVIDWIAGNTYGHYAEHLPWLEELLAQQPVS
ncbi:MAG: ClbS/DfsB family four-helix bundle protein [Chloroflexi bacterium]|nr:ClbS/DfsB family four-helix bundle protein [Chloroflexota bacterium]